MLYQNYHFNVAVEGVSKLISTITQLTDCKLHKHLHITSCV